MSTARKAPNKRAAREAIKEHRFIRVERNRRLRFRLLGRNFHDLVVPAYGALG